MKFVKVLLAAMAIGVSAAPAIAQNLVEGKQFVRVQMPQPVEVAGKVEVLEFFWYGCPHCYDFEPLLKPWVKNLPADVHFKKVPAIFRPEWAAGARIFYTLDAMGLVDKHNDAVFVAVQKERINLFDERVLLDWVAKQGIDRQKFHDMYKSFGIDGKVRRAGEMTQEYGFGGVPAMVVGGKYMPAPGVGSYQDMLRVADGLIEKTRGELKKK